MLINRKKLRDRRRKIRQALLVIFFILISGAFLGYWIWITIFPKVKYISPLPNNVLSAESLSNDPKTTMLKSLLKEKQIDFVSINTSGSTYLIHLKDDSKVIISQTKDLKQQISSLQFILSRLTMEGRQIKSLDISFDKPVVIFK